MTGSRRRASSRIRPTSRIVAGVEREEPPNLRIFTQPYITCLCRVNAERAESAEIRCHAASVSRTDRHESHERHENRRTEGQERTERFGGRPATQAGRSDRIGPGDEPAERHQEGRKAEKREGEKGILPAFPPFRLPALLRRCLASRLRRELLRVFCGLCG